MEKTEAIEFCKVHYINYLGLAEGLLYTDYCAQVAVLLYSAFKANSKGSNTGRIFLACKYSACFQDMELIRQAITDLGYGEQPYAVYRHHDIARQHYHVVSVRSDRDGNRISAWHDRQKLQVLMRRLGPELGFTVGGQAQLGAGLHLSDTEADALIRQLRTSVRRSKNPGRFRSGEEVMPQIRDILRHALGYEFISVAEFKMILKDYGLNLSMGKDTLSYTVNGMDPRGRKSTKPFTPEAILHSCIQVSGIGAAFAIFQRYRRWRCRKRR